MPVAARPAPASRTQTLADLIPGWSPDVPGACEQADTRAGGESRVAPEPSFYGWLRESGLAEKYPACAARLVWTLLGSERRPSFPARPEIGALTRVLERYVEDGDGCTRHWHRRIRETRAIPAPRPWLTVQLVRLGGSRGQTPSSAAMVSNGSGSMAKPQSSRSTSSR